MSERISLHYALQSWEKLRLVNFLNSAHLSDSVLEALSAGSEISDRIRAVEHLAFCQLCSEKLRGYFNRVETTQYWETAWRKAAATEDVHWPQTIVSKNGTYTIDIRQSESDENKGLIIVHINQKLVNRFEGREISVMDGQGRKLLRGTVEKGKVVQKITDLNKIDLNLMVHPS